MKITDLRTTPLLVPLKKPYHWSQGIDMGASLLLVEVHTDEGTCGYGECIGQPSPELIGDFVNQARPHCIGESPFSVATITQSIGQALFTTQGPSSVRRFASQIIAGVEMALWDVMGKATDRPVHELLGGAVHDEVQYFGFVQGDTPEELAADAKALADAGHDVIYVKVGRGAELDTAIARTVREAIGPKRLRLDANEAWDTLTAIRMIKELSAFNIEFIEQPTPCESLSALLHVKRAVDIPIAADQLVFTPADTYEVCRQQAADVIVLGLHESGGLLNFKKAAAIAEAAGINICLHGLLETGITTCAALAVGATIPNLDDGNQYMNHLIAEDIISAPRLTLNKGRLSVSDLPGLGFELDHDAVARAAERQRKSTATNAPAP